MKERGILFSSAMVRALLDREKTKTRRIVKDVEILPPDGVRVECSHPLSYDRITARFRWNEAGETFALLRKCPYGAPGDRLYVRETGWQPCEPTVRQLREGADTWPDYVYDADGLDEGQAEGFRAWGWKRRPAIHMPRRFSRLLLELTEVRVERVQDITEEEARAEGFRAKPEHGHFMCDPSRYSMPTARDGFLETFYDLNKRAPRNQNPWVWALTFTILN